jgi:uncharacterized protein YyaL (SSP411 family)
MSRTTYADPVIASYINDHFVPIRVDADRRPDISERYTLGAWPTTAFLTADGDVVGGGTFIDRPRMPSILERVVDAFKTRRGELTSAVAIASPPSVQAAAVPHDLDAYVFETFDAEHGGFGLAPKFPLTSPLDLALMRYRHDEDPSMARIVEATLDAMSWGGLYDDVDGGFYRCALRRDWQEPRYEKLLEVNAGMLRTLVAAAVILRAARYTERAADVLRYVQTWLADPVDGGWSCSQGADRTYYAAGDDRQERTAPAVDRALYVNGNARMVSAALHASEVLDETALGEFAVKSLERLALACYRPGEGVAHSLDSGAAVRGLLDDQIAMAAALIDVHEATGNIVYEMMAQELAHYAIRVMWDESAGGFFDRAAPSPDEQIGRMRERLKPYVANCEAARVLKRLAGAKGDHDFGARATATLASVELIAGQQGPLAADYLLALRT